MTCSLETFYDDTDESGSWVVSCACGWGYETADEETADIAWRAHFSGVELS